MKPAKFEKFMAKQFLNRLASSHLEVEQKYRVKDVHPIRKALRQMKAVKLIAGQEHNELYDYDGKLRKKKQTLRLRYHGTDHAWLTVKGPRLKSSHKKRIEIETPVSYEETKRILMFLGFRLVSIYRKYREEYKTRAAKVYLDYLPKVGWFVEIEGRVRMIRDTAQKLGLDRRDHEDRSYRKLLQEAAL